MHDTIESHEMNARTSRVARLAKSAERRERVQTVKNLQTRAIEYIADVASESDEEIIEYVAEKLHDDSFNYTSRCYELTLKAARTFARNTLAAMSHEETDDASDEDFSVATRDYSADEENAIIERSLSSAMLLLSQTTHADEETAIASVADALYRQTLETSLVRAYAHRSRALCVRIARAAIDEAMSICQVSDFASLAAYVATDDADDCVVSRDEETARENAIAAKRYAVYIYSESDEIQGDACCSDDVSFCDACALALSLAENDRRAYCVVDCERANAQAMIDIENDRETDVRACIVAIFVV